MQEHENMLAVQRGWKRFDDARIQAVDVCKAARLCTKLNFYGNEYLLYFMNAEQNSSLLHLECSAIWAQQTTS